MMTLDQFRATGTDTNDIGAAVRDECLTGSVGRLYLGTLYIEHWQDGRNGIAPPDGPTWLLSLYNEQFAGALPDLEKRLYDWAMMEGYDDETLTCRHCGEPMPIGPSVPDCTSCGRNN